VELVIPEIPSEFASDMHGWLGIVKAGNHNFRMHAYFDPDNYHDTQVRWVGHKDSEDNAEWKVPSDLAAFDCWSPAFNPEFRWLVGGSWGRGWDDAFKRASQDLVNKLKPESIQKIEFLWSNPPESARKHTNGSQTT
jgi:hypothetical protein